MQRCFNSVRLLDGIGPSLKNINKLDMGAVPLLIGMMQRGLQVDLNHFARMEKSLEQDMDRITEEVKTLTGYYINIDSGDQVADLLFKKLGLKQARVKLTNSGDRESVEDEVLTAIQHDHPVVPKLQEFKEYSKLLGTYVRPMPNLAVRVREGEWRMFPNLNHTRVPSGRLSCKDPNLLAMPTRTERGREVRKGFITDDGWVIGTVDESQIEVRIAAHRSQDKNLMEVYHNDEDIYSDFALSAFSIQDRRYRDHEGWHYPGVDKNEHRRPCKTCVLAAIYDVTAAGLLEQMPVVCANCGRQASEHNCGSFRAKWTENGCQDLLNRFYLRYPGLLWMRKADHKYMLRHGYIVDMWGRLQHTQGVRSVLPWIVSKSLREGANLPMQGGAQGTIKLTMAAVGEDHRGYRGVVYPLLQVHDELLFEMRKDIAEEWLAQVSHRFKTCVRLDVNIDTGEDIAPTWGDLAK